MQHLGLRDMTKLAMTQPYYCQVLIKRDKSDNTLVSDLV